MTRPGPKGEITALPLDLSTLPASGGARVAAFLERYVVTPKGEGARAPFRLRDWQREIVDDLYGDPRPRSGLVSLPRGNGKTTLAAALGIYALLGDGEDSPQVVVVASDERQAGITREIARRMVELSPQLSERLHIFKDRIVSPYNDGIFMSLPGDPDALHGWDPSLLVCDELHVISEAQWEAVTSAAGKRAKSLTLAISTPAASRDSLMWRLIEGHRLDPDPSFAVREYAAPPGCAIDDEDAWAEANPALDDFLHRDAMRAVLKTMRPESFRRLRLGQWVEDAITWMPGTDWKACEVKGLLPDRKARIAIGFDGSASDDATALIGCTVEHPHHLFVLGVWEKPTGPTERHWRVPRGEVDHAVADAFATYDVLELAADPFGWRSEIQAWTDEYGPRRVTEWPTNTHRRAAPATEKLYASVRDRTLTHDGNPVLTRHVLAAVVKSTPSGDVIVKDRRWSPRKIDCAVASMIALDRAAYYKSGKRTYAAVGF